MKSKLKKIVILFIGLGIAFSLNNTLIDNKEVQNELGIPKQSAGYSESFIHVDGNWTDTANDNDWCYGQGTWQEPYVIENVTIDASSSPTGSGIFINNSKNEFFIIRNCTVYNAGSGLYDGGIKLENTNNGTLTNNNCSLNDANGIYLLNCININIKTNNATHNTYDGIMLSNVNNSQLINNNCSNTSVYDGIVLSNCDNNTITGNTANDNYLGIYFDDECHNNTISGNTANGNEYGIYFGNDCNNNTISGNIANDNADTGIALYDSCYFNEISGNTVGDNIISGIYLEKNCYYNEIAENIIYNNTIGIVIDDLNVNNLVYKNFFLKNGKHAIDDGTDNKWNGTTIGNYWDNWTSPDTTPQDGIVDDPYTYIAGSTGGTDYLPIAEDGAPSITINSPSAAAVFGSNAPNYDVTITDDYLFEMWYTLDGGLHNYTFTGSTGTIEQSAWESLSDGTITLTFYASDIPGNIDSADLNIVKDATGPIIVVNSPSAGSEFGVSAPSFSITITDDHLDSVWYSLDGGLTTYAITTNATIDQTAWAALSEGPITITFYANDTLGNEESEEVIIAKTLPPDGDDPTIVIVIVVVSIVGGVVVLTGVYLFMKKRAITE